MADETLFKIGLNTGATIYTSYKLENSTSKPTSSGSAATFDLSLFEGQGTVQNNVGKLSINGTSSFINNLIWTFYFDYPITSVYILAKNGSRGTPTRHDDWCTVENNTITVKTNIPKSLQFDYHVLLLINTPLGVKKVAYTENLTHITSDAESEYEENSNFNINYNADENYIIESLTSNNGIVNISSDKLSATLSGVATSDINVVGSAIPQSEYGYITITGSFTNCTCNYSNGEQIKPNTPITITANDGYIFKGIFTYYSNHLTSAFKKTSDNKQLYILVTEDITLNDNYIAVREGKSIGGFTNIYKTSNDELKALSKVRFYNNLDYGSYILQLYVLPYTLPDDIVGDSTTIILGNYDSNVDSTSLLDYLLHIDYGDIEVPNKYNNVYDFLDTSCILRLPFFDSVPIENQYVIGQTLHIEYVIDLYSGLCGVNITSTFTGNIILSATTNIVTQVPFIQVTTDNVINQLSTNLLNHNKECLLEVTHNVSYNPTNNLFGKPTKIIDVLSNYSGYVEVDNIELSTNATNDEIDNIKKLLKSGVFIN